MIITVKNLQQQTFTIDFDPLKTVLELKEKICHERGVEYVVDKQKLIYAGVILDDDRTIASYNVDEKKFIVVMLKRDFSNVQKADESTASTSKSVPSSGSTETFSSVGAKKETFTKVNIKKELKSEEDTKFAVSGNTSTGSDSSAVMVGSLGSGTGTESSTSGSALLSTASANSEGSETSHSTYSSGDLAGVFSNTSLQSRAESNLLMGEEYNRSVDSMVEMGYSRDLVERAMAASFNNPERAVEYLISGIPPEATEEFNAPVIAEQVDAGVDQNINMSTMGSGANIDIPPGADPFVFLRNQPQFLQMRSLVYQNPDLLHAVLQQIGQTNPALLQLISENQDAFLNMLNEPIEGQPNTPPIYPHRMTPGRRAQLAAAARAAVGNDGQHGEPLDTAPGSGGDGLQTPQNTSRNIGESGGDTIPQDSMTSQSDRGAARRAAATDQFMRDRAAAAAAIAELTAAATAAVEQDVGRGGNTDSIGRSGRAGASHRGGSSSADEVNDVGLGGVEGVNIRPGSPSRILPPIAVGGGNVSESQNIYQLTSSDRDAIDRLKALGFPEALVLQAYFVCDKDEQLAANFLISSAFDD